jgi:electron transport complex protein RnfB
MLTGVLIDAAALSVLFGAAAGLLVWARRALPADPDSVVDAIEAVLPQTQCAQCGYPGCRPYAEAVAAGAAIDLCPPGGRDTQMALARLLGRQPGSPLDAVAPVKAFIDESRCVGCFLCVEACPVDAIVGAPRMMHTVISERCTGCELCLPPCPVDCIDLIPTDLVAPRAEPPPTDPTPCIRCHRCEPVCPESLPVADLWWFSEGDLGRARDMGLDRCIECGLCNAECPSSIDLLGRFRRARRQVAFAAGLEHEAVLARTHLEERQARLERQALIASDRRSRRLAAFREQRGTDG